MRYFIFNNLVLETAVLYLSLDFIHYKIVVYNVRFLYFSKAAQVILYCFLAFHSELLTSLSLCCMLNVFLSCCCFILKAVFFKKKDLQEVKLV